MMNQIKRVHIIAMGGSVMHALAIALKKQGLAVSGSDDNFFDPSRSRLAAHGLLPEQPGWSATRITTDIDVVILGMHAHADNPELKKAQELGLRVISFPEYIYEFAANKQRLVISGSHGKTTITAMVMHVLKHLNRKFDYVVGAKVKGFEETVRLSDAPVIVIEGDEYLSSRIDPTPKFLHYHHHIGLISGIAWDHVNVFPSEKEYIQQFEVFADASPKAGTLVYNVEDEIVAEIGARERADVIQQAYGTPNHEVKAGASYIVDGDRKYQLKIFGKHNLQNLNGAREVLSRLSISKSEFYEAMTSFELPDMRLNILKDTPGYTIFRDYAHAPSKVRATAEAVKTQYPDRDLIGVFELHTYSSLNRQFFDRYANTLQYCNEAVIFYNPKALEQKKLPDFSSDEVKKAFNHPHIEVFNDKNELDKYLRSINPEGKNLLLMSSANFDELDLKSIYH